MIAAILFLVVSDPIRLQGDWVMVERAVPGGVVFKYKPGEPDTVHYNLYFKGGKATMHFDGTDPNDEVEMTFSIVGKNQIDFTVTESTIGPLKKGEKQHSLYKFEGGALIMCDGDFGVKRPTAFKPAEGIYLYKFVRMKVER